jgi:chromosomal replication initiation ATPase DnaA
MHDPTLATMVIEALRCRGLFALVEHVCEHRGVTPDELCGRARTRNVARARHELWSMIRALPDRYYSYPEMGRMFRCNPATILQGVAVHKRLLAAANP